MLARRPALEGFTPITTTIEVPNVVEELYVIGEGEVKTFPVGDVRITSTPSATDTRSWQANRVEEPGETVTQTLCGSVIPYMLTAGLCIYKTNSTRKFTPVCSIYPDDAQWQCRWMGENTSIDQGYYFWKVPTAPTREGLVRTPKDESLQYGQHPYRNH